MYGATALLCIMTQQRGVIGLSSVGEGGAALAAAAMPASAVHTVAGSPRGKVTCVVIKNVMRGSGRRGEVSLNADGAAAFGAVWG